MKASWRLGTIRGIPIGLHWSMLLVFALLTVSLAAAYFPETTPDLSVAANWIMAIIVSALFFGSILLHELGHSWVAQRNGIPVNGITLFIFGGVSQITERAKSAGIEFRFAAAGPLVSFILALVFGIIWYLTRDIAYLAAPTRWLATLNFVLGLFNLVPGFPLDGGRILRSLIWEATNNERRATEIAMVVGQIVAFGLMGLGAVLALGGNFVNGVWLIFIGWFLQNAAAAEGSGSNIETALQGATVGQAMGPEEPRVPGRISLRQLIYDHVLPTGERRFMVLDGDRPRGIVTLKDVTAVDQDRWDWTKVNEVMTPWNRLHKVSPDSGLLDALQLMDDGRVATLPVVEDEQPIGLLTREEILRYVRLRMELKRQ